MKKMDLERYLSQEVDVKGKNKFWEESFIFNKLLETLLKIAVFFLETLLPESLSDLNSWILFFYFSDKCLRTTFLDLFDPKIEFQ